MYGKDCPTLLSQFIFFILSLSDTDSLWPVVTGKVVLELARKLRYVFKREYGKYGLRKERKKAIAVAGLSSQGLSRL